MEAPEKIYLTKNLLGELRDGWNAQPSEEFTNIEYIRKDAFIRKACKTFCKVRCNGKPPRDTCTSLGTCKEYDNFVKFMERKKMKC